MTMLFKERLYEQVISRIDQNGRHGLQVGERVVRWQQPSEDRMGESFKSIAFLCHQGGEAVLCAVGGGRCSVPVVALLAKEAMSPKDRRLC
jgi:hypothetical protein